MKKISPILLLLFVPVYLYSQDHVVHGVVHTFDEVPLIGAEIKIKSTKQSVFTDSAGNFAAPCNSDDRLKVVARGFYTQKVEVASNVKVVAVNLKLKPGEKQREYAIGYGYVSGEDLTNAVAGSNTTGTTYLKYNDIYDLIRGELGGVQIMPSGEIIIRGNRSFQGSSAALVVVDGSIWDTQTLGTLSPIHVKSIDVIKDGGAAVYGDRGANGVILIETIKGGDEIR